jgi:hypothetical protein
MKTMVQPFIFDKSISLERGAPVSVFIGVQAQNPISLILDSARRKVKRSTVKPEKIWS